MNDMKFDHIGLAETSIHWPYLREEYRIPQRFRVNFMIHQLDLNKACNEHGPFLGYSQYVGTAKIFTGNLTGRNMEYGKYPSALGIWSWEKFRVQGSALL